MTHPEQAHQIPTTQPDIGLMTRLGNVIRENPVATLAVTGLTALAAHGIKPPSAEAQGSARSAQLDALGNIFDIATLTREQVRSENTGLIDQSPTDAALRVAVGTAAMEGSMDMTKKITISRVSPRSLSVNLTQSNARGTVRVGAFRYQDDLDGDFVKNENLSFDGDVFTNKRVTVTPVYLPGSAKGKKIKLGKAVTLVPSEEDLRPTNAIKAFTSEGKPGDADPWPKSPNRTSTLKLPVKMTQDMLRSGKVYIDVKATCTPTDSKYDVEGKLCDQGLEILYRVKPTSKNTTYTASQTGKKGDIIKRRV